MHQPTWRLDEVVSRASLVLGGLCVVAMLVLIAAEAVARYLFSYSFGISDEFSAYLLVALVFLGLGHVAHGDAHIKVEILTQRLSPQGRDRLRLITLLLFLVFAAVMTKLGYDFVRYNYVRGTKSSYIWMTSLWIPMSAIPIGFGLLAIVLLSRMARLIRRISGGGQ